MFRFRAEVGYCRVISQTSVRPPRNVGLRCPYKAACLGYRHWRLCDAVAIDRDPIELDTEAGPFRRLDRTVRLEPQRLFDQLIPQRIRGSGLAPPDP
jgi:hypothetical protein